jgi:hypothetical protein
MPALGSTPAFFAGASDVGHLPAQDTHRTAPLHSSRAAPTHTPGSGPIKQFESTPPVPAAPSDETQQTLDHGVHSAEQIRDVTSDASSVFSNSSRENTAQWSSDRQSAGRERAVCEMCGKSFGRRADMNRHVRHVHQGRRNFRCPLCFHEFSERGHFVNHVGAVHDARRSPDRRMSIIGAIVGEASRDKLASLAEVCRIADDSSWLHSVGEVAEELSQLIRGVPPEELAASLQAHSRWAFRTSVMSGRKPRRVGSTRSEISSEGSPVSFPLPTIGGDGLMAPMTERPGSHMRWPGMPPHGQMTGMDVTAMAPPPMHLGQPMGGGHWFPSPAVPPGWAPVPPAFAPHPPPSGAWGWAPYVGYPPMAPGPWGAHWHTVPVSAAGPPTPLDVLSHQAMHSHPSH